MAGFQLDGAAARNDAATVTGHASGVIQGELSGTNCRLAG